MPGFTYANMPVDFTMCHNNFNKKSSHINPITLIYSDIFTQRSVAPLGHTFEIFAGNIYCAWNQ